MGTEYYLVSNKALLGFELGKGSFWWAVDWNSDNLSLEFNNHLLNNGIFLERIEWLDRLAMEIQTKFKGLKDLKLISDDDYNWYYNYILLGTRYKE